MFPTFDIFVEQVTCALLPELTLIVLYVMTSLVRFGCVFPHHVIVHERFASEERETARTTKYAANHVFSGLLQPMTNGVFEHLIPHHGTWGNQTDVSLQK